MTAGAWCLNATSECHVVFLRRSTGDDAVDGPAGNSAASASSASATPAVTGSRRPAVLADGTYATQAAIVELPSSSIAAAAGGAPNLRALLLGGDFFVGGVLAGTLTKLMLRLKSSGTLSGADGGKCECVGGRGGAFACLLDTF